MHSQLLVFLLTAISFGLWFSGGVWVYLARGEWAPGIVLLVLAILITLWAILITLRDILDQMKR
jgi:hypothetical protein